MKINGKNYRSIWLDEEDPTVVNVIDQERLPFFFEIKKLRTVEDIYYAIREMTVRGAPVIGAAGALGMYLATLELTGNSNIATHLDNAAKYLISSRPTAVNLSWAINRVLKSVSGFDYIDQVKEGTLDSATRIIEEEVANCMEIGKYGFELIEEISIRKGGEPVNILTHCNAGWLACIDYGTATAPIYLANKKKIAVHVWVDETRPRCQGARLTAYELGNENVPYTLVADNTGGHLMQQGLVDIVITGSDRTTRCGDVANKIGTYLKAVAAGDNNIPFYVALPSSSIDFSIRSGKDEITLEERDEEEIKEIEGYRDGNILSVRICPDNAKAANFGFDITPARLVTGLITERGICGASEKDIGNMFLDKLI